MLMILVLRSGIAVVIAGLDSGIKRGWQNTSGRQDGSIAIGGRVFPSGAERIGVPPVGL